MKLATILVAALVALVAFGQPVLGARPAHAGKPAPSGTIAIAAGSDLRLGGLVTFDYTVSDLGNHDALISVKCTQPVPFDYAYPDGSIHTQTNPVVYGEAGHADQAFWLGGSMSVWLLHGGPVECTATLFYWDFHPVQTFVPLAAPVAFSAGG